MDVLFSIFLVRQTKRVQAVGMDQAGIYKLGIMFPQTSPMENS
jgi:hypothetical protein